MTLLWIILRVGKYQDFAKFVGDPSTELTSLCKGYESIV